ncbi:protein arginine kinase [Desulfofundulus sp.]|uniref:protein arginine kinase n=1 Tax=Desulfofundulus sp. TaxID=2282750 RepID=UPI003C7547E1
MTIRETVNNPHSHWMDGTGPESDIVISSRVRVARNLAHLPFPHLLSREKAEDVIHAVQTAVENRVFREKMGKMELTRMNELTPVERQILVEKHLISPDLLEDFERKAVVLRDDEVLSVMVNEEDHLRLQCLLPGLQLNRAWELVSRLDDGLEATLDYAFDEKLGYLTACPTNVGTGLRASVMLHLPGLVMVNQIKGVLGTITKLGLTVRGLYGEGTEAKGNLFQVSNQVTLGQAEEDIIANLISVTRQLLGQERAAREALYRERREQLEDRVGRAYGLLKHARVMTSEEAMSLFSDLRLGIDMGIIKNIPAPLIIELMVLTRPAFLVKVTGKDLSPVERDIYRAQLIRRKLSAAQQS